MTTTSMTMWAIREVATENYMPVLPRGWHAGASHLEPTPITQKPPRLFTSRRGASIALSAWRQGHWYVDHGPRRAGLDDIDYDPILEVSEVEDRKSVHLEVIPVSVLFPPMAASGSSPA
jgi:hypothetical protein